MPYTHEDVAIIIPAFNEAQTIAKVIHGVREFGSVIVVDDGSTDQTVKVSEDNGAYVVSHDINKGYDYALSSGFHKAYDLGKKIIISIDADGQHDPKDIQKILEPIQSGRVKVSLGIRPNIARISEKIYNFLTQRLYGIEDVLCGLKAFHIDVFKEYAHVVDLKTMATALPIQAIRHKNKFEQTAIILHDRQDMPRIGNHIKANWRILKGMFIALRA